MSESNILHDAGVPVWLGWQPDFESSGTFAVQWVGVEGRLPPTVAMQQ